MSDERYPDENWLNDYSRRGQSWIHDNFIAEGGLEDFFPDSVPFFVECGYRLSDLNRAFDGAENARMGVDTLVKVGDYLQERARRKEERGFTHSAFEYYHRAALCYVRGSWSILDAEDPDKRDWHGRGLDAFEKVVALNPHYEMETVSVDLPFHEQDMAAVFHVCGEEDAPTVIRVPGMDMSKEEAPDPGNNRFVQRGMNVLTIDGPGQGETRLNGVCDEEYDTYQKAGRAAIDWLVERDEVDAERIGVFGTSMGSYWGPRIAFEDERVAALSTHMANWYSNDIIFNQAQPFFKKRFMYMAGITDEDAFDEYDRDLTLFGIDEELDVPTFMTMGEYDELQTREQAKLMWERQPSPKRLYLYEGEFHPLGGVAPDVLADTADWFRQVFDGDVPADEARLVPDYPADTYVPSPQFDFLAQDDRPGEPPSR